MPLGSVSVREIFAMRLLRLAGAVAGRRAAVDLGGGEAVVVHGAVGPVVSCTVTNAPSGTISPAALRVFRRTMSSGLQAERRVGLDVRPGRCGRSG